MTATLPLPAAVIDASGFMALNVLLSELTEIVADAPEPDEPDTGALVAGAEPEEELELLVELQAAMSSAALTPAATAPAFFSEDTLCTSL